MHDADPSFGECPHMAVETPRHPKGFKLQLTASIPPNSIVYRRVATRKLQTHRAALAVPLVPLDFISITLVGPSSGLELCNTVCVQLTTAKMSACRIVRGRNSFAQLQFEGSGRPGMSQQTGVEKRLARNTRLSNKPEVV